MTVEAPDYAVTHPDRSLDCQEAVEPDLQRIIADANKNGWGTIETITAIEEVMKNLRLAYAEDPDPAEDPSETVDEPEPSNDWPAAGP